jgi:hypothetical protein
MLYSLIDSTLIIRVIIVQYANKVRSLVALYVIGGQMLPPNRRF